ncbi:MAG: bifunctional demethylmenaquinone methyltransferase/2-methoxy-6-polyprenyl-1,4-benzoquinol methylase UbiE [Bacteroidetes bacterium]|jgi:demethylmenaquinone methyltransferase/2-methoxy-6-polyprenyl-1,4-benzoquinol methylase|nr:bifunctional demethylmenaquinone methyltransferase/2-methoxy-6-polyprenyl-1,4-benzoquinol methylase UbiE [Bacteroidota bacterium]
MEKTTVKPYKKDGSKKGQVTKMFDNIAPYYDFLNRFLSLGIDTIWRKKAISKLKTKNPKIVLDVATGTADLAIEISKQLKVDKIVGLDIANEMLEVGRKKLKRKGLDQLIELQLGDSENLPFEDNTFDAATVAFGVRNFENLEKGLNEIYRVLKKGGQIVVLEFSRPTIFPFKQLFNFYFKNILPLIGRFTSKDPKAYSYLYESVQVFPDGENFLSVLKQTGFSNTKSQALTLGICTIYTGIK